MATRRSEESLFRVPPYYYLHVLDQNTNVTRLEVGPQTYIRQDNERYASRLTASRRSSPSQSLKCLRRSARCWHV